MPISPQDRTTSGRTAGSSAGSGMSFVTTPTASAGTIGLAMFNTSPSLQTVPNGTAGYILVSSGPTTAPVWQPPTAVFTDDQTFASSPAGNVTMVFTPLPPSGTDGTINYTVVADVVRPVTISGSYDNTASSLTATSIQAAIDEIAAILPEGFDNGISIGADGYAELGGTLHHATDIDQAGYNLTISSVLPDSRTNEIHSGDNVAGLGISGVGFTSTKDNQLSYLYGGDATAAGGFPYQAGVGVVDFTGGNAQHISQFNGTTHSSMMSAQDGSTNSSMTVDGSGVANISATDGTTTSYETFIGNKISSGFNSTEYEVLYGNGNKQLVAYPETRDDTPTTPQLNVLYTDALGNILSAPFTQVVVAAFNGTSIDATTGKVQLGNDVGGTDAALINDREIPLNGNTISLTRNDGGLPTVFQEDGTAQIGYNLVVKGDHDGATNAGNVIVRVGDDTAPIRENSVIQMATIHVPSGNIMTENKFQRSSDYTVLERLTKPFTHDVRGYKVDVPGSIINLLGSSSTGKYKLGQTAFNTGTAFPSENPVEVLPADAGNIKNLVFNTVTGDINLEGAVNAGYRKVEKIGTVSLTAYPTTPTVTNGGKHYYEIVETLTNTPSIPFLAPIGKKWMARINGNIFPQFVSPKNVNAETFSYLRINGIIAAESQDITPIVADTGATDTSTVVAANRVDCVADVNQTVASTSAIEVMSYIRHDVAESITMPISNTGSDILGYWNLATELFLADL